MPSPYYENLLARLTELTAAFVDFDIPIERGPEPVELDKIAAFKLLVHAEIETFIEERTKETIEASVANWIANKKVNRCLFNLMVRWYPHFELGKNEFSIPHSSDKLNSLVSLCLAKAKEEISQNNSIKQDAFNRMSFSAGLLTDDLSGSLPASLDSYGKQRGDVAHLSVGKVRTLKDPRVEAEEAKQIVNLLRQFDDELYAINA